MIRRCVLPLPPAQSQSSTLVTVVDPALLVTMEMEPSAHVSLNLCLPHTESNPDPPKGATGVFFS